MIEPQLSYLYSPFVAYSRNATFIQLRNSIGEVFDLIKIPYGKSLSDAEKDIEVAKYPLTKNEIMKIFHKLLELDKHDGARMTLREADSLFHLLGIYYRLGLLNVSSEVRFNFLKACSRLYGFKFKTDVWSNLDIKEFQRLADNGLTLSEIASQMNRSYQTVQFAMKRFGIVMRVKKRSYSRWTDEELSLLQDLLSKGMKYKDIQENYFPERSLRTIIATASLHKFTKAKGNL